MRITNLKAIPTNNGVARAIRLARFQVGQVLDGKQRAMFVFGGSGMGKGHIVGSEIAARKAEVVYSTPSSFRGLLDDFHHATYARAKALPIILDEAKIIFETVKNFNLMKMAVDDGQYAPRWYSDYKVDLGDDEEAETGVSLDAPIIAMTNNDLGDITAKGVVDHAKALFDRVQPIHIPNDPLEAWEYVAYIAMTTKAGTALRGDGVPMPIRSAAMDWITANIWNVPQVSIRLYERVVSALTLPEEFRAHTLDVMLKPMGQRVDRQPPEPHDWEAIRIAETPPPVSLQTKRPKRFKKAA